MRKQDGSGTPRQKREARETAAQLEHRLNEMLAVARSRRNALPALRTSMRDSIANGLGGAVAADCIELVETYLKLQDHDAANLARIYDKELRDG